MCILSDIMRKWAILQNFSKRKNCQRLFTNSLENMSDNVTILSWDIFGSKAFYLHKLLLFYLWIRWPQTLGKWHAHLRWHNVGGGGNNLNVRVERQLSKRAQDLLGKGEFGVNGYQRVPFFPHFNKVVAYCTNWLPPNSAVIPSMTMTELYICSASETRLGYFDTIVSVKEKGTR